MAFFDPNNADDVALLQSSVRTSAELDNMASRIEWEVIDAFKQRDMQGLGTYDAFFKYESGSDPNDEILVRLIGYDETTPDDSEAGLKEALRRTIADIISWALIDYNNNKNVTSLRQGNRAVTFGGMAPTYDQFPSGWDRRLKNYDARIKPYGI